MAADRVIRWTSAGAVAGVAAMASYEHAHALVRPHGEAGRTERPASLTMDGLIYATSIVMLDSARRKVPVPALARWLLGLGIAATLAANVAHGLGDGLASATVAAWPTVALVGAYELLIMIIRSAAGPPEQSAQPQPHKAWQLPIYPGGHRHALRDVRTSARSLPRADSTRAARAACRTLLAAP
jgi:hypothetical protein